MITVRPLTWMLSLGLSAWCCLAAETIRYNSQPGGIMTIDGTSSLHDWTVTNRVIGGYMEINAAAAQDLTKITDIKAEVFVPVRSLKSYQVTMDNVMYDAMEATKFPRISYKLLKLTPQPGGSPTNASYTAEGELIIHGVTNKHSMPVTFQRVDDVRLKVIGATDLKMTDFGIKPPAPKLAMGLIKTGDEVKLKFEWLVARKTESAASQ